MANPKRGRFDYVAYDATATRRQAILKEVFIRAEDVIDMLPDGRHKSLALTALEEAYMWTGKALRDDQIERDRIERDQETLLQEGRNNG